MGQLMSPSSVSTKRVLFATDFSECAAAALPYALSLARQPDGKLVVAHVVPIGATPGGFPVHAWLAARAQGVREARASMERLEAQLDGVEHGTLVHCGDVSREISAIVRSERIDVMVLGTHGRTGIGKAVFGSVAERLFRHAGCPALTIGPNVRAEPGAVEEPHSILCPMDFSEESQAALAYAVSLAQAHQSRLYLLHVTKSGAASDRHILEKQLRELAPPDGDFSCEPRALVETGSAAQVILDRAKELAVDLIVIGPKRHSGMPGTMATAYRVVTQAICPVLTVRG
jgi:nucleotide-binding universal stress UspA family protein